MLFPFGVYDKNKCLLLYIGLYKTEADCWRDYVGYGVTNIEIAKENGLIVVPLALKYEIPKECE